MKKKTSSGNGRIARLCEKWFLYQYLGPQSIALESEKWYAKNRHLYYGALKLGPHYWEIDSSKALPFLKLLPEAL